MKEKFLICKRCGNIVEMIHESGVPISCCGENMEELIPNTVEAAVEKHIPIYSVNNNIVTVKVAEVEHPMQKEHYIKWIFLKTKQGFQRKELNYTDKPEATFALREKDEVESVYAYCNLHGLWKSN